MYDDQYSVCSVQSKKHAALYSSHLLQSKLQKKKKQYDVTSGSPIHLREHYQTTPHGVIFEGLI